MARENKARYVILGLLAHESLSGYDIKKRIEKRISNFYDISYGQIYPELARMEEHGLVAKKVEFGEKRPDRKVFSITEKGRDELRQWVSKPVEEEKVHYEILLKLFFGSQISVKDNLLNINKFRSRCSGKLLLLQMYEKELRSILGENVDHGYYLVTVLFGVQVYKAYLNWAEEAVEILGKFDKNG